MPKGIGYKKKKKKKKSVNFADNGYIKLDK